MSTALENVLIAQGQLASAELKLREAAGPEPGEDPGPVDEPAAESHLIVGKGSGKVGDTVDIEVLGQTHAPVRGYTLAIGCDPRNLEIEQNGVSGELEELLGFTPYFLAVQHRQGGIGDFLQVTCIFFEPGKTPPVDMLLPVRIPMARLGLKILPGASGQVKLTNRRAYYGKRFEHGDGRHTWVRADCMYATDPRGPNPHGIFPHHESGLVSGWVDVDG